MNFGNITWSLRSNFLSNSTDARNEMNGWVGVVTFQYFAKASTFFGRCSHVLRRHMLAMRDIRPKTGDSLHQ
ncbi:MAG: hypothetical protein IPO04_10850 [Cytophagaceae bacterium]|nr:hypothetical protein [Cytophagaceae bacterium]